MQIGIINSIIKFLIAVLKFLLLKTSTESTTDLKLKINTFDKTVTPTVINNSEYYVYQNKFQPRGRLFIL